MGSDNNFAYVGAFNKYCNHYFYYMKKHFKRTGAGSVLLFALLALLCSSSCQEELHEQQPESESGVTRKIISLEELSPAAKEQVDEINQKKRNMLQGRILYDSINDFYLDTDRIVYMGKDGHHTLSLEIHREQPTSRVENLVLNLREDGKYDAYIFEYELTEPEKFELKAGGIAYNLSGRTYVKSLGTSDASIKLERDPVLPTHVHQASDGTCYVYDDVTFYSDGTVTGTIVVVPCPGGAGEGDSNPDGHEYGNFGEGFGYSPPTPNQPGTSGGGGTGNPSEDPGILTNTNSNHHPVLTVPVLSPQPSTEPCIELKKLVDPNVQGNLLSAIQMLKTKVDGKKEFAVVTERNNVPSTNALFYVNAQFEAAADGHQVEYVMPDKCIGQAHNHPITGVPMFSFGDLVALRAIYDWALPNRKSEVYLMVVARDQTTNNIVTYALKIDNFILFNAKIDAVLNHSDYTGLNEQEKIAKIHALQDIEYSKHPDKENSFLKQFNGYGISLYEANSNLNNFTKLTNSGPNHSVVEEPCN
ncbi:MAG TPA: hypothetical protein VF581_02560 [Flavobacterium sp.]|jgi:hypothetical protein